MMKHIIRGIAVVALLLTTLSCSKEEKNDPAPAPLDYPKLLAGETSKTWYWHQQEPTDEPVIEELGQFTMYREQGNNGGRVSYATRTFRWDFFSEIKDSVGTGGNYAMVDFKNYLRHRDTSRNPNFIFYRGPIVEINDTMFVWESALSSDVNPMRRRYKTRPR